MRSDVDAVVIGAGHNGLVAANVLAEHGWRVLVLEEQPAPGGAVQSGELAEPGFTSDLFSAFYPLAAASPALHAMELERFGVRWRRAPLPVAHPQPDGRCAVLSLDVDETAASLERFAAGDGERWRSFYEIWEQAGGPFMDALLRPFPPLRGSARLAAALGPSGLLRFARFALLPVRRMAEERFRGEGAGWLLAGNALHADLTPDSAGGGLFGWVLCGLGQQHGFPVPEGGAGRLIEALLARLRTFGGELACGASVQRVLVRGGRAVGVRLADGSEISAARGVLASTVAPRLYRELVGAQHLPRDVVADLDRFQLDNGTVKVDWSLDAPIPWLAEAARRAGTLHVADGIDALTRTTAQLARGAIPDEPFLVMGQYAPVDPTRMPAGREVAWAYTHVPQRVRGDAGPDGLTGAWDERETARFVARVEAQIERRAPGFQSLIRRRHVFTPPTLEAANRNLLGGAVNQGTAQIHQQVVFRPLPGLARPTTPLRGLWLAGASAHPGGGVHGAAGFNAARAALHAWRLGAPQRAVRQVPFAASAR
ncbi:MAG TPA: NAD(P)/FAD-dependent oxidoreductase [Conexibacter sp.]|nr:NAD(P)/FAD-dependent oxidoreductase [Conexibacter sp.]